MPTHKLDNALLDLSQESFCNYPNDYSFSNALDQGFLVNITSWVQAEMGFFPHPRRGRVAVTAKLWRDLASISPFTKKWQSVTGRGNDLLWRAAQALHHAQLTEVDEARFRCHLPSEESLGEECLRLLFARRGEEDERLYIIIGYAEETSIL